MSIKDRERQAVGGFRKQIQGKDRYDFETKGCKRKSICKRIEALRKKIELKKKYCEKERMAIQETTLLSNDLRCGLFSIPVYLKD